MHYLVIGEAAEEAVDVQGSCVKIVNELTPNNDHSLNTYGNMQRLIVTKHNRLHKKVLGQNTTLVVV